MSTRQVRLSDEGYPHIIFTEDGRFFNSLNGFEYNLTGRPSLQISRKDLGDKSPPVLTISKLKAKYFGTELDKIPDKDKCDLGFMGFPNYVVTRDGRVWGKSYSRFIIPDFKCDGYGRIQLFNETGKHPKKLHRLVATAFVANPEHLEEVNHIDGNTKNNHASNLEWVSHDRNVHHATENHLYNQKYSTELIHYACSLIDSGMYLKQISELTGIPHSTMKFIKGGGYPTISRMYNFYRGTRTERHKQKLGALPVMD